MVEGIPDGWWLEKEPKLFFNELAESRGVESAASKAFAQALDAADTLAPFQSRFVLPLPPPTCTTGRSRAIYLCGNSLGPQPVAVQGHIQEVLGKWGQEAVLGWFSGPDNWQDCNGRLSAQMAQVVGAKASEVIVMNALTINLHLLLWSFYRPTHGRTLILCEDQCFPTDMHALQSHVASRGMDPGEVIVTIHRREGEASWRHDDIIERIRELGDRTALVFMSGVHYSTGQAFNMAEITKVAHESGSLVGFDLAHAAGNLCLELHGWGVDFACWCSYKYLNGGPGAMGAVFVHERHGNDRTMPRLQGWWGQRVEDRFSFAEPHFVPTLGASGFQLSTPSPVLSACIQASLDIFQEAGGMPRLRQKLTNWPIGRPRPSRYLLDRSILLTGWLEFLLQELLPDQVAISTPSDPQSRGCQLSCSFRGRSAESVLEALQCQGIICDVRKPDILRVAPNPLYNSFMDVWDLVTCLKGVLTTLTPDS